MWPSAERFYIGKVYSEIRKMRENGRIASAWSETPVNPSIGPQNRLERESKPRWDKVRPSSWKGKIKQPKKAEKSGDGV